MFSMDQNILTVTGVKLVSQVKINRIFLKNFNISPKDSKELHLHQFVLVLTSFKATGNVKMEKPNGWKKSVTTDEILKKLKDHMEENHTDLLRSAACRN